MSDADKTELRPANENPWYCLATLHGEPKEHQSAGLFFANQRAWNRWIATALSDDERASLVKNGFPEDQLAPFSPEEKSAFCRAFAVRTGRESDLPPEPDVPPDFSFTHFDRRVEFEGRLFRKASFGSAKFSRDASFNGATFSNFTLFAKAEFSHDATFDNATFDIVDFDSATFSGDATFYKATIYGASFDAATFSGHAGFSATFSHNANFDNATFSGDAFFSAEFSHDAIFDKATFSGGAYFSKATFSGDARFRSATFSGDAHFNSATFSGRTIFSGVKFHGDAIFADATFSHKAEFNSATFLGDVSFRSATFSGNAVDFVNAKFGSRTTFENVPFGNQVPDFRGATMHEATEWHGAIWPKRPADRASAQTQVYAYERLKQEMERLKKHEDEQRFFRKELRARRALARSWSGEWTLNLLYQASSNYGYSIALPLIWLFGLFITGGAVFYLVHATNPNSGVLTIWHAAALSFGNIFPFVPIAKELMGESPVIGWSRIEKAIAVGQTLLGTPLLFLLGLALRSRFRMK